MSSRPTLVTIRIRQVPPTTGYLEPFELRSYAFRVGGVYHVPPRVAEVLRAWNYAEPVDEAEAPLGEGEL
jgi:hypothetical protein